MKQLFFIQMNNLCTQCEQLEWNKKDVKDVDLSSSKIG